MNLTFITRCVEANGDDINEMTDLPQQQDISTGHFIDTIARKAGIDAQVLEMLGYDSKKQFAQDWHMRAGKSLYQGIPCYYVVHSAIEYIFVDEADAHKVLGLTEAAARQRQILVLAEDFDELLQETVGEVPGVTDKQYFEIMREFHARNRDVLDKARIPMGAFAQYQCEHRKAAASFDRKFFDPAVRVPDAPGLG